MAILSEQIYMLVRQTLFNAGITAYSDRIPEETSYPFCMYEIPNVEPSPDTAFEKDYETIRVRFNFHNNNQNPSDIVAIAEQVEDLFNRVQHTFIDTTTGKHFICGYKVDDSISFLNEDVYWIATQDYEFKAQRNL